MPFKSQAHAKRMYGLYKQGKVSNKTLMGMVHATKNMSGLPARKTPLKKKFATRPSIAPHHLI